MKKVQLISNDHQLFQIQNDLEEILGQPLTWKQNILHTQGYSYQCEAKYNYYKCSSTQLQNLYNYMKNIDGHIYASISLITLNTEYKNPNPTPPPPQKQNILQNY